MTDIIDKIMFDFKLLVSLIKKYDSLSELWSIMDDDSRSLYKNEEEFIEVSLRSLIYNFLINEHLAKTFSHD